MAEIMRSEGPLMEVGSLDDHENAAVESFIRAADSTASAYLHLQVIRQAGLWKERTETWEEYIEYFRDRLSRDGSGVALSLSTVTQQLRNLTRGSWAGVDPDTILRIPPSVANDVQRIATPHEGWVSRSRDGVPGEEEGALREWAKPEYRRNAALAVGLDPESADDRDIVKGLYETLADLEPVDGKRLLREEVLVEDPKNTSTFHTSYAEERGPCQSGLRVVLTRIVTQDGTMIKTERAYVSLVSEDGIEYPSDEMENEFLKRMRTTIKGEQ